MKKVIIIILAFIVTKCYGQIDIAEYAPGHPNVTVGTISQLTTFPVPRFKQGHTFMKNFNWMDPIWAGQRWQSGVTDAQAVINSVDIQKELAKNYNYYFNVSWSGDNFNTAWKNAINADTSLRIGMITFRAQTASKRLFYQSHPVANYLQNSSGQKIDVNGNVTSTGIWRPTAPTSAYNADGQDARGYISSALSGLNRPVNLVNENGEVFWLYSQSALQADPQVTAAKNASGLDWLMFHASKIKENEIQSYRDQFMTLPILAGANYTEYRIEGQREWGLRYEQMRLITTPMKGQYYGTTDFYVRWPNNWQNWSGPWHGLKWLTNCRHYEILAGDRLYSPFVAAGWDDNPEVYVRPAQWLGLLKVVGMYGAEFFYMGFFNESFSQTNPPPHSKDYIWQAITPPLAQGVMTYFEDIMRNGSLLAGDMIDVSHDPDIPLYQFNTGASNKVVVIRKHDVINKYAITGTIQNSSNVINSTPLTSTATINLDGENLTFRIDREGSTYIYDKSNPNAKVFYQIDGWHLPVHPSRYPSDFELEAELFDNSTGFRKTYFTSFPNLLQFRTIVSLTNNQTVSYSVFPRETSTKYLFVKTSGTGTLEANLDGTIYNFSVSGDGWYKATLGSISNTNHNLILTSKGSHEVDSISVTSNSTKYPTTVSPPCTYTYSAWSACSGGTQTRTVISSSPPGCTGTPALTQSCTMPCTLTATIMGATSACNGTNTSLTVNDATSYQWSNGATTQGVNVLPGTYTVTLTQGTCTATDSHTITGTVCSTCTAPSNIITSPYKYKVNIRWTKVTTGIGYVVNIWSEDGKNTIEKIWTVNTFHGGDFGGLFSNKKYFATIGTTCSDGSVIESPVITFTTL